MAPLEYRGRKLVDGGLVDNVPIREVRDRCGAQVVIAVNVGSPPLKAEEVSGLLSITAQMVALLTEQNVSASLAGLQPGDLLIKPDLGTITAADFGRHTEAADRGRAAAQALAARLAPLSVDEARYAAWQRDVAVRERAVPQIDEVQVAGLLRADEALVMRWIQQRVGKPLDTPELTRDLGRAFGDGHYERIDYTVVREGQRQVLRVLPVEKSWGPNYLRLGVRLDSNLSQGSSYQLRAGYQRTWINRLGGELLAVADLGSTTGLSGEWYQPLTATHRSFVDVQASYKRERVDYFIIEQRIAEYRTARAQLDAHVGLNLALLGQVRLGWREAKVTNELETGLDLLKVVPDNRYGGWLLSLDADRLDRLYFPRSGWATQASLFHSDRGDFSRLAIDMRGVVPLGAYVLGGRASWVDSPRGQLPLQEAGRLGGFLNLTGFASGQLLGDRVAYGHVRAERIIGNLPLGLRGDMRMGVALETGRVGEPYALQKRNGWLKSVALYVGGETPLGSVYLGVGQGSGGSTNAYLFIGTP
jgi:NTE family protein